MDNELLQSIGRLYVDASRLQAMVQQLQEQASKQDAIITQLRSEVDSLKIAKPVTAVKLPPELVTTRS